ncbi:hypothetical protein OHA21_00230 [Actinoplanes sp. NBC_00393]|uniref:hypothetical protein n=1 Tax=Actinoplanes sp. NBC_00393 TaxID=2975953 RepID=UPI002E248DFE
MLQEVGQQRTGVRRAAKASAELAAISESVTNAKVLEQGGEARAQRVVQAWLEQVVAMYGQRPTWVRILAGPPNITRDILRTVGVQPVTVVVGETGSGKTCWMREQTTQLAKDAIRALGSGERLIIPIPVHAGDLAMRLEYRDLTVLVAPSPGLHEHDASLLTIEECIDKTSATLSPADRHFLVQHLLSALHSTEVDFVVAIDALDEAGERNTRRHLLPVIDAFRARANTRLLITARHESRYESLLRGLSEHGGSDDHIRSIPPLGPDELETLGQAWLGSVAGPKWVDLVRRAPTIHSSIRERSKSGTSALAASIPPSIMFNPLLSSFAFAVARELHTETRSESHELPSVDALYHEVLRRLLRHEWKDELLVEQELVLDTRLDILAEIAFFLTSAHDSRSATAGAVRDQLRRSYLARDVSRVEELDAEIVACSTVLHGVDAKASRNVRWSHPSLGTWLVAHHLFRSFPCEQAIAWLRDRWWHDSTWQDVTVFYAGRVSDSSALFEALEVDGQEDPLAVIDQLAVRCASYLQSPARSKPAMRRLLAIASAGWIEAFGLRNSVLDTIARSGGDVFPEQYRATMLSDQFQFREAMVEQNPVAQELLQNFLLSRKHGALGNDSHVLLEGIEEHLCHVDNLTLDRAARTLTEIDYEDLADLRVVETLPPAYRLSNAIALELRRRGGAGLSWPARTFYLPYHVEALLSVGDADNAYAVMIEQPFDDSQEIHPHFDEYAWDPELSRRLTALASERRHPLVLRVVAGVAAALRNRQGADVSLLEGLLTELTRGFEQLWESDLAALRPLMLRSEDGIEIVSGLIFLTPDAQHFPTEDNIGGEFHEDFLASVWDDNLVTPQVRSDLVRILARIENDNGGTEIFQELLLIRDLLLDGLPVSDLDEEGDEGELSEPLLRFFPFVAGAEAWEAFVLGYMYYQGKVHSDCIVALIEICLAVAVDARRNTIIRLVERLIRNPLFPLQFKALCVMSEIGDRDLAIGISRDVMRHRLFADDDSAVPGSSQLFSTLASNHQSMMRSYRFTGSERRWDYWWNWDVVGGRLLEEAVKDWTSTEWHDAYLTDARQEPWFIRELFGDRLGQILSGAELADLLSEHPPRRLLDRRLLALVDLEPAAAKPWIETLLKAHLKKCQGWPYCVVDDDWPPMLPEGVLACLSPSGRKRVVQHVHDYSTDAMLGDERALQRLIKCYGHLRNGNVGTRHLYHHRIEVAVREGWARAAAKDPLAMETLAREAITTGDSGLLWEWSHLVPAQAKAELEAALAANETVWTEALSLTLLRLGSLAGWRRVVEDYIMERRHGSSLRSIWHWSSMDQREGLGPFFVELVRVAVQTDDGERAAPSIYEAWEKVGQELTLEEAIAIRRMLGAAVDRLRTAFISRPS